MASLKVAVRVRPLSEKESFMGSSVVVDVQGKDILVTDVKVPENHSCDHRVRVHRFAFDFGFLSVDSAAKKYASQKTVYEEFGRVVLNAVLQGYNSCVIAYGPSGSGKTYTMMGSKEENGLTPRICEGLFTKLTDQADNQLPFQIDISFMEIYNEQVFDLLQHRDLRNNRKPKLRIREHPIHGPFVEGLSTHAVKNMDDVCDLLAQGNECRVNAATHIHDRSSRSHAIFTIRCSQACINETDPREVVSKLHLVDLAGSEKAAPEFCQSRVKEGGNINKSLVTLGNVISVLVELSLRSKEGTRNQKQTYVPYRDSHLTWLLKDSLGGNSHTFMLAAISPSKECYIETVSTLRYAQRAKFVVNKPVVNEDPGTEMIRNLQTEVRRLRNLLMTAEKLNKKYVIKPLPDVIQLRKIMEESSRKVDMMTKHWFEKWLKTYDVVLNRFIQEQNGLSPGKCPTGLKDAKLNKSGKHKLRLKLMPNTTQKTQNPAPGWNSHEKGFGDSSECFILCDDIVGFSKKNHGNSEDSQNASDAKEMLNCKQLFLPDIKSQIDNTKTSLVKNCLSYSDNVLNQRSHNVPYSRCLSLGGINVSYPYCNYSWITLNKTSQVRESFSDVLQHDEKSSNLSIPDSLCDVVGGKASQITRSDVIYEIQDNVKTGIEDEDNNLELRVLNRTNEEKISDNLDDGIVAEKCKDFDNSESQNPFDQTLKSTENTKENTHNISTEKQESSDKEELECSTISKIENNYYNYMTAYEESNGRNDTLPSLKCNEIKFSEQVKEESKIFLDLLTGLNYDTFENTAGFRSPQRKDSEIMSLLSFSSLDCPVWRSLDDFLGSSEETSSIQGDDHQESSHHTMLEIRRYNNRKTSCSSVDSTTYYGFVSTNATKEIASKEESIENIKDDNTNDPNFKPLKLVTFNNLTGRTDYDIRSTADLENCERSFKGNLTRPTEYISRAQQVIYDVNIERENFRQLLMSRKTDDNSPDIKTNPISEISTNGRKYSDDNSTFPELKDSTSDNENSEEEISQKIGHPADSNENKLNTANCNEIDDEKYRSEEEADAADSKPEVSKFYPFGLKLTKANLDLLAERLSDCTETDKDQFDACIAYALDVNTAKGNIDSEVGTDVESQRNLPSFSLITHDNGKFYENSGALAKIIENDINESSGSLADSQSLNSEKECEYDSNYLSTTEVEAGSQNSIDSALTADGLSENEGKIKNSLGENTVAKTWQKRDDVVEGIIKKHLPVSNSSLDSIPDSRGGNLRSITEDDKDNEIINKEKESLLNSTFTSDSLENFEQEMIEWANKYLTRNKSISSSYFVPEKNLAFQSVNSQELCLDEFEFTTESNECENNDIVCDKEPFQELDIPADTPKDSSFRDNQTLASSRSSSSDSITYVFVGTEDKGNSDMNVAANMSQYSSLPSSVSLDSLERNAFRPKLPCLSPRTLSIDSLIAEELLAQLRSGELPPACRNGKSFPTPSENLLKSKSQYTDYLLNEVHENTGDNYEAHGNTGNNYEAHENTGNNCEAHDNTEDNYEAHDNIESNYESRDNTGNNYEANITETFSPESNCSFDVFNSDNNKMKQNSETNFCPKVSPGKAICEVNEASFESSTKKLQRFPLGASQCFMTESRHHTPPIVRKSATNSEIYRFLDIRNSNSETGAPNSSHSSSTSQEHSEMENKQYMNFETLAKNCQLHVSTPYAIKQNVTDSIFVPPPTSFTIEDNELSRERIKGHDQSTQTCDSFGSNSHCDDTKNALPPNTLELILRMMEMMTETIKFLKNEKPVPPTCCGCCKRKSSKQNVKQKVDYYDDFTEVLHKHSSLSSESNTSSTYQMVRPSSKKYSHRHLTSKSNDRMKSKLYTQSDARTRRNPNIPGPNNVNEGYHYSINQHHHTIPFDHCNKVPFSKTNASSPMMKKYRSFTPTEDNSRFLSLQEPENDNSRAIHPSQARQKSIVNFEDTNCFPHTKLVSSSRVGQNRLKENSGHLLKIDRELPRVGKISHANREKPRCVNKRLYHGRRGMYECSETSSSEGYLSSVSSITASKRISDDTTDSAVLDKSQGESMFSKQPNLRARHQLKPLVLNTCPEDQRTGTPTTSWQNTSADSGAFFMDSPLAENKSFCNTNRSPETSNLLPLFKETLTACAKDTHAPSLKVGAPNQHFNYCDGESPGSSNSTRGHFTIPAMLSPGSTRIQKGLKTLDVKNVNKHQTVYSKGRFIDADEEYSNMKRKTPSSSSDQSSIDNRHLADNTTAEELSKKLSDDNYRITRQDIEKILASIEKDKDFLRRRRNPIFDRKYSPELRVCSPFEEENYLFLRDSYKSLPNPVLYVRCAKDTSLAT